MGISDTAFRIFIVMASRRIMTDEFFTTCFNATFYSQVGLDLVNNTNSLLDVLKRHRPEIAAQVPKGHSAFTALGLVGKAKAEPDWQPPANEGKSKLRQRTPDLHVV